MKDVIVVIGAGSIGQAVARRVSAGTHVLLADVRDENAKAAASTLSDGGFDVSTAHVDVSSRASVRALVENATARGPIMGLIHAAGVSPSQASPQTILEVDLYQAVVKVACPAKMGVACPAKMGSGLFFRHGDTPGKRDPTPIFAHPVHGPRHPICYGTALVLEEFGNVIARGAAGVVIASQSGIGSRRFQSSRAERSLLPRSTSCCNSRCCSPIK